MKPSYLPNMHSNFFCHTSYSENNKFWSAKGWDMTINAPGVNLRCGETMIQNTITKLTPLESYRVKKAIQEQLDVESSGLFPPNTKVEAYIWSY